MSNFQVTLNGVNINFPYKPYKLQEDFMSKVIHCLQEGKNGLLESPTGTGKTLSLLCASIAWLETRKALQQAHAVQANKLDDAFAAHVTDTLQKTVGSSIKWDDYANSGVPRIIYSSRTHTQLSQAVQELKRTSYKYVQSVVLGSRDQMCLHPEVSQLPSNAAKLHRCRAKVKNKSCPFYLNVDHKLATEEDYIDNPVLDIEDLVTLGKKHTCCPYYASRTLKNKANIIFTPYNYLVDSKARKAHGIELEDTVVIFDEAHNIESVCEDSMSFNLRSQDLALCISEVTQVMESLKNLENFASTSETITPDFLLSDVSIVKVILCELEYQLDKDMLSELEKGLTKSGDFIFDLLARVELTLDKKDVILDLLDKIILYLMATTTSALATKGAGLEKFSEMLKTLFLSSQCGNNISQMREAFKKNFKIFIQNAATKNPGKDIDLWTTNTSKKGKSWVLDGWCFCPGLSMRSMLSHGVHSMILTSGTLAPLNSFATELEIPFSVQLENPHIIEDKQVFVGVIPNGPDGTTLNSSYRNRSDVKYLNSLGRTIMNFSRVIPDGLLVFFPSYSVLRQCVNHWQECGIWESMSAVKSIFMEPQGKAAFHESINQYYEKIVDPNSRGATFFAVCRGKVSEGLDFSDRNARAVIITGLPFAPSQDPRVMLKMDYLNNNKNKELNGQDWYVLQASRAVNQAVGRVIRHKNDYGAVFLCDNRFSEKRFQNQLSKWVRSRVHTYKSFGLALRDVTKFFKTLEPKRPQTSPSQPIDNVGIKFSASGLPLTKQKPMKQNTLNDLSENSSLSEAELRYEQYQPTTNSLKASVDSEVDSKSVKRKQSIFDAMDAVSNHANVYPNCLLPIRDSNEEDIGVNEEASNKLLIKKRKLNVKLRGLYGDKESPELDDQEHQRQEIMKMWMGIVTEIKSLLGPSEEYAQFRFSVKQFKDDKDVNKFTQSLQHVFRNVHVSDALYEQISKMIPSEKRSSFLAKVKAGQ